MIGPVNIWLLDSPEMVLNYSLQGGRVIFITEDNDPKLEYIPNKLSAKILLPPYEVVCAELDGRLDEAEIGYYCYLSSNEPADYISVILAALVGGISVGLYFGSEMKDLKYPQMFINYLYNYKGIVVGYKDVKPNYMVNYVPSILGEIYGKDLISVERFMTCMPVNADIPFFILPKLIAELRPPKGFIKDGDYNSYFKNLILGMNQANKYLYCPIIATSEEAI